MAWEWWPVMPDMKWTSAAVYGRRALSSLALATAATSDCERATDWVALWASTGAALARAVTLASITAAGRERDNGIVVSVNLFGGGGGGLRQVQLQGLILPPSTRLVSSPLRSGFVCALRPRGGSPTRFGALRSGPRGPPAERDGGSQ